MLIRVKKNNKKNNKHKIVKNNAWWKKLQKGFGRMEEREEATTASKSSHATIGSLQQAQDRWVPEKGQSRPKLCATTWSSLIHANFLIPHHLRVVETNRGQGSLGLVWPCHLPWAWPMRGIQSHHLTRTLAGDKCLTQDNRVRREEG